MKPAEAWRTDLLCTLASRFERHPHRHPGWAWQDVVASLERASAALHSLRAMEDSGGEPDVIGRDAGDGRWLYCDCAPESPQGRRSLCYDEPARLSRKTNRPVGSAVAAAAATGVELLDEAAYHALQTLGEFDCRTSSWLSTPAELRARGGALFGDRRYGRVFVYHNGADAFFAARGFRGMLRV
jgi:hypothetical protein